LPLPPIVMEHYTVDQYRYIAGFLLRQRAGILQALESVTSGPASMIPLWQSPQARYYRDAESLTRYLLWVCGYGVEKNQMYTQEVQYVDPGFGP